MQTKTGPQSKIGLMMTLEEWEAIQSALTFATTEQSREEWYGVLDKIDQFLQEEGQ